MGPDAATLPSPAVGTPWAPRIRGAIAKAVVTLLVAAVAGALGRSIRRVEVAGESMAPTFLAGDRLVVLARPFGPQPLPPVDSVVAVADPRDPSRMLVKRVVAVDRATGSFDVGGDNPGASTDSRAFGPVHLSSLSGRVVYRYAPAGRTGPGPWCKGYDRQ
jgi:nickel-type superoxide dismutase maturation protease